MTKKATLFEATVTGFDPGAHETDDLVLWIAADDDTGITAESLQKSFSSILKAVVRLEIDIERDPLAFHIDVHFKAGNYAGERRLLYDIAAERIIEHDVGLSAEQLQAKYSRQASGEHPIYDQGAWRNAARLSYWDWVSNQIQDGALLGGQPANEKTVDELRHAGYCIVMLSPTELGGVNPASIASKLTQLSQKIIDDAPSNERSVIQHSS